MKFSEKSRKFEKMVEGEAPALRVVRAETRLTVHRSLAIPKTIAEQARVGPRTQVRATLQMLFWRRILSTLLRV